jgi:phage regulator Rha-like protein
MYLKFSYVYQEEKEHAKAFREMEEKLMTTAFHRLVSCCFNVYLNDSSHKTR